jgi:hypothetical protein
MRTTAERMKFMRERRRTAGMRELRLTTPDARLAEVRARIAVQATRLDPDQEGEALDWLEAVSEFDAPDPSR